MELEQAERVFRYHATTVWPDCSDFVQRETSIELVIRVDDLTDSTPVHEVVSVRAEWGCSCIVVKILWRMKDGLTMPIGSLSDTHVLYRLGGTLIKVANMLEQIAALGGTDDPAGR